MNFATLQGLTIPEGNVTQITDSSGRVIWKSGPNYKVIHNFGTVTATSYLNIKRCTISNFNVNFDPTECNAIMVDGVLYEVVGKQDSDGYALLIPGAVSTFVSELYPYSVFFAKYPTDTIVTVRIYSYQLETFEISIGKLS